MTVSEATVDFHSPLQNCLRLIDWSVSCVNMCVSQIRTDVIVFFGGFAKPLYRAGVLVVRDVVCPDCVCDVKNVWSYMFFRRFFLPLGGFVVASSSRFVAWL